MRILALISLLATLASCNSARDDRAVAEAINAFHRQYSAGNFSAACSGDCEQTLRTTFAILGPIKASRPTAEDLFVYKTEFQRGVARERFAWNGRLVHTIEIDFGDLAVGQWKEFRGHWAAGSIDAACAMTLVASCHDQLQRASNTLGKPEISKEEFAGSVSRSRQKPFPKSVRLETQSSFANGAAQETFEWEIQPETGFRVVSFSIERKEPPNDLPLVPIMPGGGSVLRVFRDNPHAKLKRCRTSTTAARSDASSASPSRCRCSAWPCSQCSSITATPSPSPPDPCSRT